MEIKVIKEEKLIKFLIHNIQGLSFSNAQKLLRLGKVKVNDKKIKENISLRVNDVVKVYQTTTSMPKVDIIYEDDNILIVNKPQGIECATRDKSSDNTYSLEEIFSEHNAIVVHRLDRLTEGLVILARKKEIAIKFEKYFKTRKIRKFYKALVFGKNIETGKKIAYLRKDANNSKVTISATLQPEYKEIVTEIISEEKYLEYSLLNIELHTGRTHQIRAHLSFLNHPIVGDSKYSQKTSPLDKLYKGYYLTSYKLKFELDDELSYLNDLNLEIQPSWLKYIEKTTLKGNL